jgi:linoleate 10R-lipoxygenase
MTLEVEISTDDFKVFTSFEEWNSDPAIWKTAEKLYGNIDFLELYVGLQAEEAK